MQSPPSEIHDEYWIRVYPDSGSQERGPWTGKWMLLIPTPYLDESWTKIAEETERGRLGIAAKTATMKLLPNAVSSHLKLICVYTADCRTPEDVLPVLEKLRGLGFKGQLNYKEDNATYANVYGPGSSLWTSPSGTILKKLRDVIEPPTGD
jgi:hypothetical protein